MVHRVYKSFPRNASLPSAWMNVAVHASLILSDNDDDDVILIDRLRKNQLWDAHTRASANS